MCHERRLCCALPPLGPGSRNESGALPPSDCLLRSAIHPFDPEPTLGQSIRARRYSVMWERGTNLGK